MMLPRIAPEFSVDLLYQTYLDELQATPFSGDIRSDYAARIAVATDNSIYQVIPQAVIFPKTTHDMVLALRLGHKNRFQKIKFSPRGGGVAANGQSLSSGIIIDCSKYLCQIRAINVLEKWVSVEPGVVQDQLNEYLLPYGFHFAPEISPSNRATLGGMINTDACGNGQKLIGRTSDHVLELTGVLSNGTIFSSLNLDLPQFKEIECILASAKNIIQNHFPKTPRTLSGYNLLKAYTNQLNLNYLLCGSEGTLAVISECKLKITPLPKYKKCVVLQYRNFDDALRAVDITENIKPLVVECIDETLLQLARNDSIYFYVKHLIENNNEKIGALNLVEFVAEDKSYLQDQINQLCNSIDLHKHELHHAIGYYVAEDPLEIKKCWELRKKSVGLISKNKVGTRRPVPFIEDTAVPPEQLVNYINELKQLLDSYSLTYGMYGHVDAGCVHVRPALDLQKKEDQLLHQTLSDQVVSLVQKYHGVMWGEHGMGFRTQYNALFLGDALYEVVRKIKTVFDPLNKLNPGKIALPFGCDEELVQLAGPLRGQFDSQVPEAWQSEFASAFACNGNGACFNYSTQEYICPSYKVTKDRIHSPKGRAVLMREWLRLLSRFHFPKVFPIQPSYFFKRRCHEKKDFSHEVFNALNGCLGCKACTSQCPLNVDIPDLKARFLNVYHTRYRRPIRDYCIAAIETIARYQSSFPRLFDVLMSLKISRWILKKWLKMIDAPYVSLVSVKKELKKRNVPAWDIKLLAKLSDEQKEKTVILLQDAFTCFYYPEIFLKTYDVLTYFGFTVYATPFFINGKPYHTKGFLKKFYRIAQRNINYLNTLGSMHIPLVGLDPSITLTYRDEYMKIPGQGTGGFHVLLPQEWLSHQIMQTPRLPKKSNKNYFLLSHCTEKTMCVASEKEWITIFKALGLLLKPLSTGCCGMSGSFGHEIEHVDLSHRLFQMSWQPHIDCRDKNTLFLTTGYSCRSQVERFQGVRLLHPLEALYEEFIQSQT